MSRVKQHVEKLKPFEPIRQKEEVVRRHGKTKSNAKGLLEYLLNRCQGSAYWPYGSSRYL